MIAYSCFVLRYARATHVLPHSWRFPSLSFFVRMFRAVSIPPDQPDRSLCMMTVMCGSVVSSFGLTRQFTDFNQRSTVDVKICPNANNKQYKLIQQIDFIIAYNPNDHPNCLFFHEDIFMNDIIIVMLINLACIE